MLHVNSAVLSLVTVKDEEMMESLPPYQAALTSAHSVSPRARLEIRTMEISTMTLYEAANDELELIEMRYQQALALNNLVTLFAEGLLDC
jgi:hypothetical protein